MRTPTSSASSNGGSGSVSLPSIANAAGKRSVAMYSATRAPLRDAQEIDELMEQQTMSSRGAGASVGMVFYGSEQHMANMTTKSTVLDNEDQLITTQEGQLDRCRTMRAALTQGNERRQKSLHDYDDQFKWCTSSGYEVPALHSELRLAASLEEIRELGPRIEIPDPGILAHSLHRLLLESLSPATIEVVENDAQHVIKSLSLGRVHIMPTVIQLHELIHSNVLEYLQRTLKDKDALLQQLYAAVEKAEAERLELLERDEHNVNAILDKYAECCALWIKIITCIRERLNEILMASSDPENFRKTFNQLQNKVMGALDDFQNNRADFQLRINQDLQFMHADADRRSKENEAAIAAAAAARVESHKRLEENAVKQDDVWRRILAIMEELKPLCDERRAEVQRHMELHEEEEERKYRHGEFMAAYYKHTATLQECLAHTDAALQMVMSLHNYFDEGIQAVTERTFDEALNGLRDDEMKRYCDVVRQYTTRVGDLIDRKQQCMHGALKLTSNLRHEQQLVRDSLDPDFDVYASQIRDLGAKRNTLQREVGNLEEDLSGVMLDFAEVEQILKEQGAISVSPLEEWQAEQVKRRTEFLQKRRIHIEKEHKEIDNEVQKVKQQEAVVRMEQDAHVRRVADGRHRHTQGVAAGGGFAAVSVAAGSPTKGQLAESRESGLFLPAVVAAPPPVPSAPPASGMEERERGHPFAEAFDPVEKPKNQPA